MLFGLGVVLLKVLRFSGGALAEALSPTGSGYNPWPILLMPIFVFAEFQGYHATKVVIAWSERSVRSWLNDSLELSESFVAFALCQGIIVL